MNEIEDARQAIKIARVLDISDDEMDALRHRLKRLNERNVINSHKAGKSLATMINGPKGPSGPIIERCTCTSTALQIQGCGCGFQEQEEYYNTLIVTSEHSDDGWRVRLSMRHQSFTLAYEGESLEDAEWMAFTIGQMLEKAGARASYKKFTRS